MIILKGLGCFLRLSKHSLHFASPFVFYRTQQKFECILYILLKPFLVSLNFDGCQVEYMRGKWYFTKW